jgi:hypothetical protein
MSKTIHCPACGMHYDIPDDTGIDRWSCDCGAAWELGDD